MRLSLNCHRCGMTSPDQTTACGGECVTCPAAGSCPDRIVCRCLKVDETTVITAIRVLGAASVKDIKAFTGAGDGCMCCHRELRTYLSLYSSPSASPNKCSAR